MQAGLQSIYIFFIVWFKTMSYQRQWRIFVEIETFSQRFAPLFKHLQCMNEKRDQTDSLEVGKRMYKKKEIFMLNILFY